MTLNSIIKKIEKINADLVAYEKVAGDTELPIIDCTVSGFEAIIPYSYKVADEWFWASDFDGNTYHFQQDDETAIEELNESLKYDRRRLNKAWRVWKSDNPDLELEQDTEEE